MNEKKYKRIFTVVIDSLGAGEMPDAASYGDAGTDTLGHIAANVEEFKIPNLQKLGIANLKDLAGVAPVEKTLAYYGKLREASNGKDTMTGHWEMMGLHITTPFKTFTETGFPKELIDELSKRTGRTIIGNKSASGTEILDELAEEEWERTACRRRKRSSNKKLFCFVGDETAKLFLFDVESSLPLRINQIELGIPSAIAVSTG